MRHRVAGADASDEQEDEGEDETHSLVHGGAASATEAEGVTTGPALLFSGPHPARAFGIGTGPATDKPDSAAHAGESERGSGHHRGGGARGRAEFDLASPMQLPPTPQMTSPTAWFAAPKSRAGAAPRE